MKEDMVLALIEKAPDESLTARDSKGDSILQLAVDKKLDEVAAALMGRLWEEELQGDGARVEALWGKAVEHGMVDSVRALVERSGEALTVAQIAGGQTALDVALMARNEALALLLIDKMPADTLQARDKKGETCLHVAVRQHLKAAAVKIVQRGGAARINSLDFSSKSLCLGV